MKQAVLIVVDLECSKVLMNVLIETNSYLAYFDVWVEFFGNVRLVLFQSKYFGLGSFVVSQSEAPYLIISVMVLNFGQSQSVGNLLNTMLWPSGLTTRIIIIPTHHHTSLNSHTIQNSRMVSRNERYLFVNLVAILLFLRT